MCTVSWIHTHRKRLFETLAAERGRVDLQLLMDFHASHAPIPSAYSPCMHRENALTVSFSRVTVADGVIEFLYFPVAPCARRRNQDMQPEAPAWKFVQIRISSPHRRRKFFARTPNGERFRKARGNCLVHHSINIVTYFASFRPDGEAWVSAPAETLRECGCGDPP
jgi:hypothetical protein